MRVSSAAHSSPQIWIFCLWLLLSSSHSWYEGGFWEPLKNIFPSLVGVELSTLWVFLTVVCHQSEGATIIKLPLRSVKTMSAPPQVFMPSSSAVIWLSENCSWDSLSTNCCLSDHKLPQDLHRPNPIQEKPIQALAWAAAAGKRHLRRQQAHEGGGRSLLKPNGV